MKSKLSTTLALVGVLAAGTAAAAVNTQALQSRAESTIGVATTTLITPAEAPAATVVTPTVETIQLDANVATTAPTQSVVAPKPTKASSGTSGSTASVSNTDQTVEPKPYTENSDDDESQDYEEYDGDDD